MPVASSIVSYFRSAGNSEYILWLRLRYIIMLKRKEGEKIVTLVVVVSC